MPEVSDNIFTSEKALNSVIGKVPIFSDFKTEEQLKIINFPYLGGVRYEGYAKILQQDLKDLIDRKLLKTQTAWDYHINFGGSSVTTPTWTGQLYLTRIDYSSSVAQIVRQINTGGGTTLIWADMNVTGLTGHYEFNPPLLFPLEPGSGFQMVVSFVAAGGVNCDLRLQGFTEV